MNRAGRLRVFLLLVTAAAVVFALRFDPAPLAGRWVEVTAIALASAGVLVLEVTLPASGNFSLESPLILGAGVALASPQIALLLFTPGFLLKRLLLAKRRPQAVDLYNLAMVLLCYGVALESAVRIFPAPASGPELIREYFAAYAVFLLANLLLYLAYIAIGLPRAQWAPKLKPLYYEFLTLISCAPVGVLGLLAIPAAGSWGLALTVIPLGFSSYAFRQYFEARARNRALQVSQERQEFLVRLSGESRGTLDLDRFFGATLQGLNEVVAAPRMAILVSEAGSASAKIFRAGSVTAPDPALDEWFKGELEAGRLAAPEPYAPGEKRLTNDTSAGLKVPLSTVELVFGVLLVERDPGEAFAPEEARFLGLVGAQLSTLLQDQLLKTELFASNNNLERRNMQLSRILEVSDLMKGLDSREQVFAEIVRAVRECAGFRVVLLSIYHEASGELERVAQAGLDAQWPKLKGTRRAAEAVYRDFQPENKLLNSFYIRHDRNIVEPGDVISMAPVKVAPGEWHAFDSLLVPITDRTGRLIGLISVDDPLDGKAPGPDTVRVLEILANQAVAAIEAAQAYETIRRQARFDGLTEVYNHREFQEALARECERARRSGGHFALALFDLDNFKRINDEHGHPAGDQVLREVARRLRETVREADFAARYGGEEFAVIYPDLAAGEAEQAAERLRERIAATPVHREGAGGLPVTISIGLAAFPADAASPGALIAAADRALYGAKRAGKNRVQRAGRIPDNPGAAPGRGAPPDPA